MKKAFLLIVGVLLLSGCSILRKSPNTAGQITDSGPLGSTVVQGVGNADKPATLDRKESNLVLEHQDGDELQISAKSDPKYLKELLEGIVLDEKEDIPTENSTENPAPVKKKIEVSALPNEWSVTYRPKKGAKTSISGIEVKASTGYSKEDTAAITAEILNNSRAIMYVGIALVLGGIGLIAFFKVPAQGGMVSAAGVGMIVLQSTLANPMWSWVMIGVVVLSVPAFWLWHLKKNKKVSDVMVKSIEEFKNKHPDKKEDLETLLSKNMAPSEKKMIREKKVQVIK